jgi:hypothetical protein
MVYTKPCPICKDILIYPYKYLYNRSIRENRHCRSCAAKLVNKPRKIKSFSRRCPSCNGLLEYSVYHTWWWANKHNQVCRMCGHAGKILTEKTKQKISLATQGEKNPMYGHHHTEVVKCFISNNNKGNKSKSGQICDINAKMNMRSAAIKRIKIQGTSRSYNPVACDYMDKITSFSFIHARNSKDEYEFRGYFADGYDKNKNIWFEYDESYHYKKDGILKNKDINRMYEIIQYLGCRFIRYNEHTKLLTEYFHGGIQKTLDNI